MSAQDATIQRLIAGYAQMTTEDICQYIQDELFINAELKDDDSGADFAEIIESDDRLEALRRVINDRLGKQKSKTYR